MSALIGRPRAEEADHWHRRLLCARRERPRSRRAAEQRNEIAAFHSIKLHAVSPPAWAGLKDTVFAAVSQRVRWTSRNRISAREWLAEREAELLPVPYYHVVYTLPARIADIAYQNKAVIYDLLFNASSDRTGSTARPANPQASRP